MSESDGLGKMPDLEVETISGCLFWSTLFNLAHLNVEVLKPFSYQNAIMVPGDKFVKTLNLMPGAQLIFEVYLINE